MEADHLRENPQTPQQQETLQAITSGCKRLMRLLLAANNQATRRNEIIKSYLQLGSSSNRYAPRLPNKKQNHLQNSLLRRTQFWVRKTFSKPASLKRTFLVALPVAICKNMPVQLVGMYVGKKSSRKVIKTLVLPW